MTDFSFSLTEKGSTGQLQLNCDVLTLNQPQARKDGSRGSDQKPL